MQCGVLRDCLGTSSILVLPYELLVLICQRFTDIRDLRIARLVCKHLNAPASALVKHLLALNGNVNTKAWAIFPGAAHVTLRLDDSELGNLKKRLQQFVGELPSRIDALFVQWHPTRQVSQQVARLPEDEQQAIKDAVCCLLSDLAGSPAGPNIKQLSFCNNLTLSPDAARIALAFPGLQKIDAQVEEDSVDPYHDDEEQQATVTLSKFSAALEDLKLVAGPARVDIAGLASCSNLRSLHLVQVPELLMNVSSISSCRQLQELTVALWSHDLDDPCYSMVYSAAASLPDLHSLAMEDASVAVSSASWETLAGAEALRDLTLGQLYIDHEAQAAAAPPAAAAVAAAPPAAQPPGPPQAPPAAQQAPADQQAPAVEAPPALQGAAAQQEPAPHQAAEPGEAAEAIFILQAAGAAGAASPSPARHMTSLTAMTIHIQGPAPGQPPPPGTLSYLLPSLQRLHAWGFKGDVHFRALHLICQALQGHQQLRELKVSQGSIQDYQHRWQRQLAGIRHLQVLEVQGELPCSSIDDLLADAAGCPELQELLLSPRYVPEKASELRRGWFSRQGLQRLRGSACSGSLRKLVLMSTLCGTHYDSLHLLPAAEVADVALLMGSGLSRLEELEIDVRLQGSRAGGAAGQAGKAAAPASGLLPAASDEEAAAEAGAGGAVLAAGPVLQAMDSTAARAGAVATHAAAQAAAGAAGEPAAAAQQQQQQQQQQGSGVLQQDAGCGDAGGAVTAAAGTVPSSSAQQEQALLCALVAARRRAVLAGRQRMMQQLLVELEQAGVQGVHSARLAEHKTHHPASMAVVQACVGQYKLTCCILPHDPSP
jgi:hypothetical protein